MAAPFGLIQGLSQDLGYGQRINDLRYNEQQDKIAGAEAEARAKLFAEDMNYKGPMNSYDAPLAKDYAYKKMKEIGQFAKDNPNYRYDPMLQVELKNLKTEIKDNPIIRRGMATDEAYKQYLLDRQEAIKNPNSWDMEMLDKEGKKFENYFQHGHSDGAEAKLHEGEKPVVYTRPKMFVNLDNAGLDVGNSIKDFNIIKGTNIGEYSTEPKPEHMKALTDSFYAENERQLNLEAKKRGYPTGYELAKNLIAPGVSKHYSVGDENALWERGMRERELAAKTKPPAGTSYTPFDNFIDKRIPAGRVSPEVFRKVYGDKPKIELLGNSGSKADLTGLDFNYDGRYVKRNGIPMLLGYVKVPLSVAKEKGIISEYDPDDETAEFKDTKGRITSDYIGKAAYMKETGKDGKPQNYINVSYQMPINPNDNTARQMYNVYADVDKLVPESKDPFPKEQESSTGVYTGSKEAFKKAGWSDEQIQQGVQQGKIKIQ